MIASYHTSYIGIPFVDKGRTSAGIDCWGLFRMIYQEQYGIELPSFTDAYKSGDDFVAIKKAMAENMDPWIEIPTGEEVEGDGVTLRMIGHPHIAVVVGDGHLIHSDRLMGVVVERYDSVRLRNRVLGFYRHRDAARA